jgi:hypothetical protein
MIDQLGRPQTSLSDGLKSTVADMQIAKVPVPSP